MVFLILSSFLAVGCGSDQPRDESDTQYYTDHSTAIFAPQSEPDSSDPFFDPSLGKVWEQGADQKNASQASAGGWSIILSSVERGEMKRAVEMLRIIQEEAGLDGAYIDRRNSGLVIAYGEYLDRNDPKAIADLKKVKAIDLMGVKLFEGAVVVPPSGDALRGTDTSSDLRGVKERYGKNAVYTLQIGIYGRDDYQMPSAQDLIEFRKAAENAASELRGQGVMAFYYHAPARSMVTVGVFSERDFDATTLPPTQSRQLRELRERFPNNLLNGQGINETVRTESGKITRLQSSQLVAIPEK
ncbi:MAG: hypothetical protein P1U42_08150 [Phycisphaerales bacterium]|nr:hypothetical protein [Phycisphaerales bacterium]